MIAIVYCNLYIYIIDKIQIHGYTVQLAAQPAGPHSSHMLCSTLTYSAQPLPSLCSSRTCRSTSLVYTYCTQPSSCSHCSAPLARYCSLRSHIYAGIQDLSIQPGQILSAAQLAHLAVRPAEANQVTPLPPPSMPTLPLIAAGNPSMPQNNDAITNPASHLTICDTGELLPSRLLQCVRDFTFVEVNWFLPAPLMPTALQQDDCNHPHCHCSKHSHSRRSRRTVDDIFTWLLRFHHYAAALCPFHPRMIPELMAYANSIQQAHLQFTGDGWRVYDRAFRVQAAFQRQTNWRRVDASLYARFVTAQSRWSATCQFCCSAGHRSNACPWGVDEPSSQEPNTPDPRLARLKSTFSQTGRPICISWNAGACRFPDSCRFQHVCSACSFPGHRSSECRRNPTTARGPPMVPLPPAKRAVPSGQACQEPFI